MGLRRVDTFSAYPYPPACLYSLGAGVFREVTPMKRKEREIKLISLNFLNILYMNFEIFSNFISFLLLNRKLGNYQ